MTSKNTRLTEAEMAAVDKGLGKYAHMTDRQLAKVMDCDLAGIADLRERGCRQNSDGTWNLYVVYGHFCRRVRGRRLRKKPSKF